MNDEIAKHIDEIRSRIKNVNLILNNKLFFEEVDRLIIWINSNKHFIEPIDFLNSERFLLSKKLSNILNDIYLESVVVCNKIKSLDIKSNTISPKFDNAFAALTFMINSKNKYNALDFYHETRYAVEELANTKHQKSIQEYLHFNENNNPLLGGKIYMLFLKYNFLDQEFKKSLETTNWGAWIMLQEIHILSNTQDPIYQIKNFTEIFKREQYSVFMVRFSDFVFDYYDRRMSPIDIKDLEQDAVWDRNFTIKNHTLLLSVYGSIKFEPNKSPTQAQNGVEKFVKEIIKSGKEGLSIKQLQTLCSLNDNDISSFTTHMNNRFDKARINKIMKAIVMIKRYGERGNKKIKLIVSPAVFP